MVQFAPNINNAKKIIENQVYSIFDLEISDSNNNNKVQATASKTILNPREMTRGGHYHEKDEWYYFKSGEGIMFVGNTSYEVTVDSIVFVPHGQDHRVFNTARSLNLEFYTFYAAESDRPVFKK